MLVNTEVMTSWFNKYLLEIQNLDDLKQIKNLIKYILQFKCNFWVTLVEKRKSESH